MLPKPVRNVKNAYIDLAFADNSNYIFSYRNSVEEVIEIFKDRIEIHKANQDYSIPISNNISVKLSASEKNFLSSKIIFSVSENNISFAIDTISSEKYLDIFPMYDYIRRLLLVYRS